MNLYSSRLLILIISKLVTAGRTRFQEVSDTMNKVPDALKLHILLGVNLQVIPIMNDYCYVKSTILRIMCLAQFSH